MIPISLEFKNLLNAFYRGIALLLCMSLMIYAEPLAFGTAVQAQQAAPEAAAKIPNEQLDSLVAPIALYPDPLLSQILVASTYPLEIVQLSQWMQKNSKMAQDKMVEAVKKENWDASVQGLVVLPDLVKNLAENIKWTTDIGNAFLAQQNDVMDAVQRMRVKAKDKGNLKSSEQQKVETKVVENKTVVVIEPAKTEVVYVPSYDPVVVYGAPAYPYPAYAYPPPGYYAAGAAISFGVGMMVGAAWGGGGWGYGCGWGSNNNVTINNNNNFVNNSNRQNIQGGNRNQVNAQGKSNWQHNPQHRGGAPYSDRSTANKYGGTARGDSMSTRQANARQQQSRGDAGVGNRASGTGAGSRGESNMGGNRPSASTRDSGSRGGGGDRIGNQSVSRDSGSRSSAFGGGGSNRSSASASSSRGASSMGRSGGGGGGRSGGGGRRR